MRIAVIGSGIAGLSAAWLLARPDSGGHRREVHLFEAGERLGGHTHTHDLQTVDHRGRPRRLAVDSGFIVHNQPTYPNLTALLVELAVATQPSDMSFGLEDLRTGFSYAGSRAGLFPSARALTDPVRLRLAAGITRFNRHARRELARPATAHRTLGDFLVERRTDAVVAQYYVLPMAAAIWSTGTGPVRDFPLRTFLEFFDNHGLLSTASHHPWRTITGGASSYIPPLTAPLAGRVHLGTPVRGVTRDPDGVTLTTAQGASHRFDKVVIATHADQSLAMLADPSPLEKELLGQWQFSVNRAWLHTDVRLLPAARSAWASWNVRVAGVERDEVSLTYWMNRLQSLEGERQYLVTLNPTVPPDLGKTIRRMTYAHPLFTAASVGTQRDLDDINDQQHTFFCGAWQRHGFHEDGLWSAIRVARHFGVDWGSL